MVVSETAMLLASPRVIWRLAVADASSLVRVFFLAIRRRSAK